MKAYLLRDIPDWLWDWSKAVAKNETINLRQLIFYALRKFCEESGVDRPN